MVIHAKVKFAFVHGCPERKEFPAHSHTGAHLCFRFMVQNAEYLIFLVQLKRWLNLCGIIVSPFCIRRCHRGFNPDIGQDHTPDDCILLQPGFKAADCPCQLYDFFPVRFVICRTGRKKQNSHPDRSCRNGKCRKEGSSCRKRKKAQLPVCAGGCAVRVRNMSSHHSDTSVV